LIFSKWHNYCSNHETKKLEKLGGVKMKLFLKIFFAGILFVTLIGVGHMVINEPHNASACGWNSGAAGGGDYVPQRRGSAGPIARKSFLTKEQAADLANNHVRRLNPSLKVGQINDAGSFYEIQIIDSNNDVVQRLGVDKQTGRLILIN
jgi:hypothetical protein